jgi:hypothetical protein
MAENLARQLIAEHLIEGEMLPDAEIALKIDQFLLQAWELEYGRDGQSEGRIRVRHSLSPRQVDVLLAGGGISWMRRRLHGLVQKRTLASS